MLLIVDDEPVTLRLTAQLLEGEFPVRRARTARRALGVLSRGGIVAMLSELELGHGSEDGVWLLREVARRWPTTRRVLFTPNPTPEVGVAHLEGAIHRILFKPATRSVIVHALGCERPHHAPSRQRILYVAPDAARRENVAEILDGLGYETVAAPDGRTALDLLPTCKLLLTELQLPDMDALDLLRAAEGRYPLLPRIVLTAGAPDARLGTAENGSAHEILSLPFRVGALEETIAAWLGAPGVPDHASSARPVTTP